MSLTATGTLARAIAYARRRTAQVASPLPSSRPGYTPPPPSAAQLAQRARYAAAIASWHAASPAERDAYAAAARARGITTYAQWLSAHMTAPPPAAGTIWDDGATTWDGGTTTWDT